MACPPPDEGMLALRAQPVWAAPSGHPAALAQGLWAGGGAIVLLVFAGLLGDLGIMAAIAVTAVVPGALFPLAVADILARRQASHPWLSGALAIGVIVALAWLAVSWVLPSGLPLPPDLSTDAMEVAVPTLAGLLAGAERCAAWGRLAWRDRLLGAAAGYAVVGGVFLMDMEWVSWAVLLGALALRLPARARVALAVLGGAGALGIGQFVAGAWTARLVEVAAFAAYAAASLALARLRPAPPAPPGATRAAAGQA
jgi:hypothetical protein